MSATYTEKLHIIKVQPTDYFISDTFNNILDDIDSKVLGIDHLQTALHWTEWEENTTYIANDVVRWPNMKSHQYAKCITGGTSGGIEPGNNVTGSVLTEGSVTWKVMSLTEATDNSAPIMIWLGGEIYSRGDVVIYANALYRAKVNHTASGTFEPDKSKWQEIYASIRPWVLNKFYYEDDTVIVNNVIYKCNADHTSASTFINTGEVPYWDIVGNLARASEWHSVTNYLKDQLITKNGLLYRAVETHTSSGVFTDDTLKWEPVFASIIPWTSNAWYDQDVVVYYNNVLYKCIDSHVSGANFDYSKWQLLHDPNGFIRDWVGSTHYYQYQLVRYNGNVYRCNTANNDANFTIAKWDLLTDSINDWVGSRDYVVGQYVNYNGILYKCITANNDANFTISKWQKVSGGGIDSWSANTDYIVGDVVVYANKIYQCNTSHTSQSTFTPDASKWTEISACITRIPDWLVSTDYVVGDLVAHDAKIYRCTTAHTSGNMWNSTEEANWEELSPTINEISDWAVSTDYAVGQLVIHNDKLYRCNTAHTSDSTSFNTDIAYWDAISDSGGIESWTSNEPYSQGNMVVYNDKIYVCDTAHTSTSTFDPTKWHEVSTGDIKLWASSTDYSVGNDIIYHNKLYRCKMAHTSTSTFDVTKWEEISPTKLDDWQASTDYAIGDYVVNNNKIYKCTTAHTSTSTFDKSKWVEISSYDIDLWQAGTDYSVGNLVIQDNKIYRCNTSHTSDTTSFGVDIANWDEIGSSGIDSWEQNKLYSADNIVIYNNKIYKCITGHTSSTTFDPTKWIEVSTSDLPLWQTSTDYYVGNLVIYDNQIYRCITAHTSDSTDFDIDIVNWQLLDTKWLAPQWSANKLYIQNEVVMYDSVPYKVNTTHTSSSAISSDNNKLDFVYANLRKWASNTYYRQGSIVIDNGGIYRCKASHISKVGLDRELVFNNSSGIYNKSYPTVPGSHVDTNTIDLGEIYSIYRVVCTFDVDKHLYRKLDVYISSDNSTFTTLGSCYCSQGDGIHNIELQLDDIYSGRYIRFVASDFSWWGSAPRSFAINPVKIYAIDDYWELLSGYPEWIASSEYVAGDIVTYNGDIYRCEKSNSDSTFNITKWYKIGGNGINIWKTSTDYSTGDVVLYQTQLYKCLTNHTSTTFNDDIVKWIPIDNNCYIHDWATSTAYYVDNVVKYNNGLYRCKTQHVSTLDITPIDAKLYEASGEVIDVNDITSIPYTETIDIGSIQSITDIGFTEVVSDMTFTYTVEVSSDNINYIGWTGDKAQVRYIKLTVDSVNINAGATNPRAYLDNFTVYGDSDKWEEINSGGSGSLVYATNQDIDNLFI